MYQVINIYFNNHPFHHHCHLALYYLFVFTFSYFSSISTFPTLFFLTSAPLASYFSSSCLLFTGYHKEDTETLAELVIRCTVYLSGCCEYGVRWRLCVWACGRNAVMVTVVQVK